MIICLRQNKGEFPQSGNFPIINISPWANYHSAQPIIIPAQAGLSFALRATMLTAPIS